MNLIRIIDHNVHQEHFDKIKFSKNWSSAFDWFNEKQVDEDFVDPVRLNINTLYTMKSPEYGIDFKILINRVRDAYADQVVKHCDIPTKKYCSLCVDSIDQIGQHKKQFVRLSLNQRDYVLSLTPFPSFEKHCVLSLGAHQPMFMDAHTIEDLLFLQNQLGDNYSVVSNSDHTKTGASILDHHHVQVLGVTSFPVVNAKSLYQKKIENLSGKVLVEQLHFPASVIRLSSQSLVALEEESKKFLSDWRAMNQSNTCNLLIRQQSDYYEIYFILRHPSYETDSSLLRYKTEGIGVIEMCGFGIFPTPKIDTDMILKEIEDNTADIMIKLLQSHAPNPLNFFINLPG